MSTNVTTLPTASLRRSWPLRLSILGVSFSLLTYYALHNGSYSLIDRQQIAVFVWVAIGLAAICGVLPAVKPPRLLLIPLLAILGMAAWTLLSLTWTESAERTFAEFARIIGYLGVLVLIWIGVGRTTWRLVAAGLLAAGVLVCFLTLMSRLWPSVFPSDTVAINLKTTRINYPFGYWNAVGCWSAMTVTLCLAYAGHARSAVVRGLSLAVVPMCAAGLFLAVSRAGFGGAILGALVVIVLAHSRWLTFVQTVLAVAGSAAVMVAIDSNEQIAFGRGTEGAGNVALVTILAGVVLFAFAFMGRRYHLGSKLKMRPTWGLPLGVVGILLALAALIAATFTYGDSAYDQFTGKKLAAVGTASPDRLAQLNGNRHNLWDSAWRAFESEPITGIGPGTYEFWWNRDGVNGEFVRDAHNAYLETLAETGLVGAALFVAFLLGVFGVAIRQRKLLRERDSRALGVHAGLVGVFVVFAAQASLDWMWESTAIVVFGLTAIGVATAIGSDPTKRNLRATESVGLLLAAICAVIVMLPGLASQRQIEKSQAAFRANDLVAALATADDAIRAESWNATAHAQRALALAELGRYPEARKSITKAEELETTNWRWPLVAIQIDVATGDTNSAIANRNRAIELRRYLRAFGESSPIFR